MVPLEPICTFYLKYRHSYTNKHGIHCIFHRKSEQYNDNIWALAAILVHFGALAPIAPMILPLHLRSTSVTSTIVP